MGTLCIFYSVLQFVFIVVWLDQRVVISHTGGKKKLKNDMNLEEKLLKKKRMTKVG